jgi:hypothetical protein
MGSYIIRYSSPKDEIYRHAACTGDMRNANKVMAKKPEGKTSLGGPRHQWEGNIKMDLTELQCWM